MSITVPVSENIIPPAPTTIAKPIIVALAVIAARDGWRVRLPCASSPVPSRAKTSASNIPNRFAIGLTNAGATSTKPTSTNKPPSATSGKMPVSNPTTAMPIITAPTIVPTRLMRCIVSPSDGRNASIGVTRLAFNAGNSPAKSVTPTPNTIETMNRDGSTTGTKSAFINCLITELEPTVIVTPSK